MDKPTLEIIEGDFTICKLTSLDDIIAKDFCFIAKTDEEISLVTRTNDLPNISTHCDGGWKAMRAVGKLDFSLVGILSSIASVLADNNISIFAVSTFDTDYILVKASALNCAVSALKFKGYKFKV